ncbi:hypothetical protein AVEN_9762-1 [Araneus ventricosus]|uniref:Uncharacterized protein n=1 Tax=Araneus ventricosus TaxID=182803 RepID=A0A4Y2TQW1_ARAVE|nr:hypothetical protein AVEN_9762-1 [Araneus ventricosus]
MVSNALTISSHNCKKEKETNHEPLTSIVLSLSRTNQGKKYRPIYFQAMFFSLKGLEVALCWGGYPVKPFHYPMTDQTTLIKEVSTIARNTPMLLAHTHWLAFIVTIFLSNF